MRRLLALDQLRGADLENGREQTAAAPVIARDSKRRRHVAAGKLRENHAGAVAVQPPDDLDPLLPHGRIAFHLDLEPLFGSEPHVAGQVERKRARLYRDLRVDPGDALQILQRRFQRRRRLV